MDFYAEQYLGDPSDGLEPIRVPARSPTTLRASRRRT